MKSNVSTGLRSKRQKIAEFRKKLRAIEDWRSRVLDTLVAAENANSDEIRIKLIRNAIDIVRE